MVKQVSVFVENTPGILRDVLGVLADNNINIDALSVADTTSFGIVRMIVEDAEKAQKVLSEEGLIVRVHYITAIAVNDEPGALISALDILKSNGVAIEYMYAFGEKIDDSSVLAVRTDNQELAEECLKAGGVKVI